MTDDPLDEIEAAAVARLKEFAPLGSNGRRPDSRWVMLAGSAAVAIIMLLGAAAWSGSRSTNGNAQTLIGSGGTTVPPESTVSPAAEHQGSDLMEQEIASLSEQAYPAELPSAVLPVTLPAGWYYDGVTSSSSQPGSKTLLQISFMMKTDTDGKLPAIVVCVTSPVDSEGCGPLEEGSVEAPLKVRVLPSGAAFIYGSPSAVGAWASTEWTTDRERVAW